MDNTSKGETQHITLGLIVSWVLGIFLLLPGITFVFSEPIVGLMFTLAGIVLLPPTHGFLSEKLNISISRGVQIIIVIVLLGIGAAYIPKDGSMTPSDANGDSEAVAGVESKEAAPALKVTAIQLSNAYRENEIAADATYKNKQVEVTGIVDSIGKDILDMPFIAFESYEYAIIDRVQCMFAKADESKLAAVSQGQQLTVRGEVSGKFGNIIVKACQIVK